MRIDEVSRSIRATPAAIYRAFIDRNALLRWLPPKGMTAEIADFDPRVGGGYRMVLTYSEDTGSGKSSSKDDVVHTRYVALETDRRVVHEVTFESDKPEFAGTMRMTWAVEAGSGETTVTFTAENVPKGIEKADHLKGLGASLDNLAELLA